MNIYRVRELKTVEILSDVEAAAAIYAAYTDCATATSKIQQTTISIGHDGSPRILTVITWAPGSYVAANRFDTALRKIGAA